MRKFVLLLTTLFAVCVAAQTVESQKLFDNVEFTIKGGVSALTHPGCNNYEDWAHTLQASTTLGISKWITPKYGIGLESTVGWENGSMAGFDISKGWTNFQGRNWINYVNVVLTSKFNLNNILHGYKGKPDRFELIPTVGIGWVHGFKYNEVIFAGENTLSAHMGTKHTNDIMTKYSVDMNLNVSKRVKLTLSPYFAFNLTGGKYPSHSHPAIETTNPKFDSRNSWYGVEVGLTYRVGKQFTLCPYKYTQEDIDRLNNIIDNQRNNPKIKERIVEKVVEHVVIKQVPEYIITFAQGSYDLDDSAMGIINAIPKDVKVKLIGGASPEGSNKYNMRLSQDRVYVVKSQLESRGIAVLDADAVGEELGSRVVIIKVQ